MVPQGAGGRGEGALNPGRQWQAMPSLGRAAWAAWPARQLLLTCDKLCLFSWSHSSERLMFNSPQPLGPPQQGAEG